MLAHLVALAGPITHRPRDPDGPFGALVRAIVYQQLAGHAAQAIHQRVRATVGETLTPETLTAVPDHALRAAGLSANKLASLRDLSAKILGNLRACRTRACRNKPRKIGRRRRAGPDRDASANEGQYPVALLVQELRELGSRGAAALAHAWP